MPSFSLHISCGLFYSTLTMAVLIFAFSAPYHISILWVHRTMGLQAHRTRRVYHDYDLCWALHLTLLYIIGKNEIRYSTLYSSGIDKNFNAFNPVCLNESGRWGGGHSIRTQKSQATELRRCSRVFGARCGSQTKKILSMWIFTTGIYNWLSFSPPRKLYIMWWHNVLLKSSWSPFFVSSSLSNCVSKIINPNRPYYLGHATKSKCTTSYFFYKSLHRQNRSPVCEWKWIFIY
jgi:hypothetical protein